MSFEPTLRVLLDGQALTYANRDDRGYQYSMKQLEKGEQSRLDMFARGQDIDHSNFRMYLVEDIATGERVRNFQTSIAARFQVDLPDGTTEVRFKLGSGDIVAARVEVV